MQDAVIVSAVRTAVGKAPKGTLSVMRPDELGAVAIKGALDRVPAARSGVDRRRDPRLRDARGRAGHERRAHREPARRHSGRGVRRHHQPLLLVRAAGHRLRRRAHHARPGPRRRRRRHRVDEHGADGRQQDLAESGAGRRPTRTSTSAPGWSPKTTRANRPSRAQAQDAFALRSHQRAIAAIEKGHFKNEIVPLTVRLRRQPNGDGKAVAARAVDARGDLRHRRGSAPRHLARGAGEAEAGVPRQRHRHRRQLVADQRRRRGRDRHLRRAGEGARPDAARALRRLRHRRRARRSCSASARCRRSGRC